MPPIYATVPAAPQPLDRISALSLILPLWLDIFGDKPVRARDILNYGIDKNPLLLLTLDAVLPGISTHPHPPRLTRWLNDVENLPIEIDDSKYRVAKVGHRWVIMELKLVLVDG